MTNEKTFDLENAKQLHPLLESVKNFFESIFG